MNSLNNLANMQKMIPQIYFPVFAWVLIQAPHVVAQKLIPQETFFLHVYWLCAGGHFRAPPGRIADGLLLTSVLLQPGPHQPRWPKFCFQQNCWRLKKGCSFFAYSWKLPAYSGAFLLTVGNCSFSTYNWSFLAYSLAFLLTVGAFLLTVGKCV